MKDSKISLLLLVSLSMLLLAFVVLFIWGFTYYKQSIAVNQPATFIIKDSSAIAGNIRDSLQKMYSSTIHKLYEDLDSTEKNADAMQEEMDAKLQEFVTLKNEIALILQNSSSPAEIDGAKKKLEDLQLKTESWRLRYNSVNEENKRLNLLIKKLAQQPAANAAAEPVSIPVSNARQNNNIAKKTAVDVVPVKEMTNAVKETAIKASNGFEVAGILLKAVMKEDELEKEIQQASQADEMKGSFVVKNAQQSIRNAEIYIVVVQPDGKVMKQSSWESGLFETTQGRKIYSVKMRFDYNRAENKTINFSISADRYQKGVYTLQVYYNGSIIARASKSLS